MPSFVLVSAAVAALPSLALAADSRMPRTLGPPPLGFAMGPFGVVGELFASPGDLALPPGG